MMSRFFPGERQILDSSLILIDSKFTEHIAMLPVESTEKSVSVATQDRNLLLKAMPEVQ